MKKVVTLCLFIFTIVLGTQSVAAQNAIEINAEASEKTEELRKVIKFDNDQHDQIYLALKAYGKGKATLSEENTSPESLVKLEKQLYDKVKEILSEEQYIRFKEYFEEN